MPLPTSGAIPLVTDPRSKNTPAFLIKLPEETWSALQDAATEGLGVTIGVDGVMTLNIPNLPPIPLDARSTGTSTEVHTYTSSPRALSLGSIAATRLSVPFSSASTARAADKMKAQNEAIERERKERAIRVEGSAPPSKNRQVDKLASASAPMGTARTHSSQQMPTASTPVPSPGTGAGQPMIPLKTRVMQLLALGPTTVSDIVRRVGGDEQNVMRVVNVVGRASSSHPPTYTLLPNQYSKIKVGPGQWKYTYAEQQQVIRLAREAFDELGLPDDAEERVELDRKETEAMNGYHSAASSSTSGNGTASQVDRTAAVSSTTSASVPVSTTAPPAVTVTAPRRTESPAPSSKTRASNGKSKTTGPQSKIARERAKFMAERGRSTSAPGSRPPEGVASPRITPATVGLPVEPDKERVTANKDKRKERENPSTRDYSSEDESKSESSARGRSADRLDKAQGAGKERRERLSDRVKEKDRQRERELRGRDRERGTGRVKSPSASAGKTASSPIKPSKSLSKRDYSDSESGEEGEIRGRPKAKTKTEAKVASGSGVSTSHDDHSGNRDSSVSKRKPPPPELKLNGNKGNTNTSTSNGSSTATDQSSESSTRFKRTLQVPNSASLATVTASDSQSDGPGPNRPSQLASLLPAAAIRRTEADPETLRDRYEELFPAYQQLTEKLSKIHQEAESGLVRASATGEEVRKMVRKWERWHNELSEIRRWFGEGEGEA